MTQQAKFITVAPTTINGQTMTPATSLLESVSNNALVGVAGPREIKMDTLPDTPAQVAKAPDLSTQRAREAREAFKQRVLTGKSFKEIQLPVPGLHDAPDETCDRTYRLQPVGELPTVTDILEAKNGLEMTVKWPHAAKTAIVINQILIKPGDLHIDGLPYPVSFFCPWTSLGAEEAGNNWSDQNNRCTAFAQIHHTFPLVVFESEEAEPPTGQELSARSWALHFDERKIEAELRSLQKWPGDVPTAFAFSLRGADDDKTRTWLQALALRNWEKLTSKLGTKLEYRSTDDTVPIDVMTLGELYDKEKQKARGYEKKDLLHLEILF